METPGGHGMKRHQYGAYKEVLPRGRCDGSASLLSDLCSNCEERVFKT